jgi:pimeloyl-ACP methyl ester carboxylesterase
MRMRRLLFVVLGILAVLALALVRPDVPRDEILAAYAGPTSRFANLEGMRVHYRDEGQGPPLVLLHGNAASLHTWDGWVTRLASHRRVIRLDMPGYGLTGAAPDHDYSVAREVRVASALLDQLGVARVDIAGNSFGGRVATTFALEHPDRVNKLVLVDAAGLAGQRRPATFRFAQIPILGRLLKVATPRWLIRKNLLEVYGDPSHVDEALVDRYDRLTRAEGNRSALFDRLNGPPDPDLDGRLAELKLPVLLVWGERDRWIPVSFGERFAAGVQGAKFIVLPGLGHVPQEEDPETTAREVDRFLGG